MGCEMLLLDQARSASQIARSRRLILVRTLLLVAAMLLCCQIPHTTSSASAQGLAPFELPDILSASGAVAYSGQDEQQTTKIIEGIVNKTGGIQGHPLKFVYLDDQSNPQVAVQLMSGLISHNAQVVLGPTFTAPCAAVAPLVEKSGPFMYCLTPGFQPARGGYVTSPGTSTPDVDETYLRYMVTKHWTRLAVLTTTDATGQAAVVALQPRLALPEFQSVKLVAMESMNAADISVNAQLQRIKAAQPDMIYFTGSGPPYATTLRGLIDAGMDIPVASSSANMTLALMQQYKEILPKTALFTASRGLAVAATPKGPIHDAQRLLFKSFEAAKIQIDGVNVLPWDPTWILITALRHLGPNATASQVRDYVLNLHGWVGINGVYNFSRDNRGIGSDSVVVYRWDPAKVNFVPASGPGGAAQRK